MDNPAILRTSYFIPGMKFLQYQLLEEIGVGGQGVVWSATDQAHNQIVAVKFSEISTADTQELDAVQFERQTRRIASLRHKNILALEDFGIMQGVRYLVSRYIPGGSLQDRLTTAAIDLSEKLRIAEGIAAALDYLHEQNIIHRDLKPANVLLDFSRNIYVTDFGLARTISEGTQAMHTGHGTPPYAPPEQHSRASITIQSDIFSFGIMLYELFAGQLPWNGEKSLGLQQLYSREELPDPCEVIPTLPPGLVTLLRQVTAPNPATRPALAWDIIPPLYRLFDLTPPTTKRLLDPDTEAIAIDVKALIEKSLTHWDPRDGTVDLTLTKFAYIDLQQKRLRPTKLPPQIKQFMLYNALVHGYDDDFWWGKVENPRERLEIAGSLISKDNQDITARLVRHILGDSAIRALKATPSPKVANSLLDVALTSKNENLKQDILELLYMITRAGADWQETSIDLEADRKLAYLAGEESDPGDQAARLIGHLRSTQAVETVRKRLPANRRAPVLVQIREAAGSLPPDLPLSLQFLILIEWAWNRITARPLQLGMAYALAALGAALGSGLQTFLTLRLLGFMDMTRFVISFERGLFLGVFLGLGFFLIRLLTELFPELPAMARMTGATLTGGLFFSATILLYDLMFLNTPPNGVLFVAGCLLIALGHALAGVSRSVVVKIVLTYLGFVVGVAGAWFGHLSLAGSPFALSPIFYYEYTWEPLRVWLTILSIALPPAILANFPRFTSGTTTPPNR